MSTEEIRPRFQQQVALPSEEILYRFLQDVLQRDHAMAAS